MFVDRVVIQVKAGKGGDGRVSFRREKFEPKGGPNGGDGGKGGDVVAVAEEGLSTLYDLKLQGVWAAENGEDGGIKQLHGRNGKDLIIRLPPGSVLYDHDTGQLLHDLGPKDTFVVARGGKGGFGNEHFKSPTHQTPRTATAGEEGQRINLRIELKLIAEVGLVGMPNAGKSTLLKALTRANPKIADYPFTTLSPQLGIAEVGPQRRIVLADIPGLIEGASRGAGLGHEFLRHVERTKVLVHLLDCAPPDGSNPADNYRAVRRELREYSLELSERPELVVLNKLDQLEDAQARDRALRDLCRDLELQPGRDAMGISGAAALGLGELLERLWSMLHPRRESVPGWKVGAAE